MFLKINTCDFNLDELEAIDNLMDLWGEGHTGDDAPLSSSIVGAIVPGVSFRPPLSLKPKSLTFAMLINNPNIWAFVQQMTSEITKMDFGNRSANNLSLRHRQALKSLQNNSSLVVKLADKGGNVVIMDVENYKCMCWDILNNMEWYHPISKNCS